MSKPTQTELDALARFAGLESRKSEVMELTEFYYKVDGDPICVSDQWNPFSNPVHADLVLRALEQKYDMECDRFGDWTVRLYEQVVDADYKGFDKIIVNGDTLKAAFCNAALEVIAKEKE